MPGTEHGGSGPGLSSPERWRDPDAAALATEALAKRHAIHVGRETLRRWMMADGMWLSRKQRKTFHQPRLRRESYGELVQIDGGEHRWFEGRGAPCTSLVFIDDSTSRLMQLRFVPSDSTASYFEALQTICRPTVALSRSTRRPERTR